MFGSPPTDDSPRRRSPFAPRVPAAPAKPAPAPPAAPPQRERSGRRGRAPAEARAEAAKMRAVAPVIPVRRLVALAIGGFSALLAVGLIMGVQTSAPAQRLPFGIVVLGAQLLYVFAATMAIRPPSTKIVAGVGVTTAVVANFAANEPATATLLPLGAIAAAGFVIGSLGQLMTKQGRMRMTESIGSTLVITLGIIFFASLLVLVRVPLGTQTIVVCLASCGVALSVARLADVVMPYPRLADQVPRGAVGVIAGTMMGTGVAAYIGKYLVIYTPETAAIVGAIAAAAAVLADLTIGFAETGRELEGDAPTMWLARHMQGPLAGFALAAPVAYLINGFIWNAA